MIESNAPSELLLKIQTDEEELVLAANESPVLVAWTKGLKSAVEGIFMAYDFFVVDHLKG